VIDLHCHILPGLDDGARDIAESVEIARRAAEDGTRTIVATPHVREDHPYELGEIEVRTRAVNARLEDEGVDVRVVTGAEVALSRVADLDDSALAGLCLGRGPYLLVESPYLPATVLLEAAIDDLQKRGIRPVLAHPERSPTFMGDRRRLAALVERGVACSITAGSMAGQFGGEVQRVTRDILERGLAHNVASDAHDPVTRAPGLTAGFGVLDPELPGLRAAMAWFTEEVPAAILAGEAVPAGSWPPPPQRRSWRLRGGGRD
jgi:protein-tyrosine phosphatase